MEPIRILSDDQGYVTAAVEINNVEYIVTLNTIQIPTARRNEILREKARNLALTNF